MITKRQYVDAQKTIRKYHEQLLKGQYQFLFFINESSEVNEKWIKAKNIEDACQKMKKYIDETSKNITTVDYEVMFERKYIDISENELLKNLM